jgi:hypothetical protein
VRWFALVPLRIGAVAALFLVYVLIATLSGPDPEGWRPVILIFGSVALLLCLLVAFGSALRLRGRRWGVVPTLLVALGLLASALRFGMAGLREPQFGPGLVLLVAGLLAAWPDAVE